jgi:hypothetical protein
MNEESPSILPNVATDEDAGFRVRSTQPTSYIFLKRQYQTSGEIGARPGQELEVNFRVSTLNSNFDPLARGKNMLRFLFYAG